MIEPDIVYAKAGNIRNCLRRIQFYEVSSSIA